MEEEGKFILLPVGEINVFYYDDGVEKELDVILGAENFLSCYLTVKYFILEYSLHTLRQSDEVIYSALAVLRIYVLYLHMRKLLQFTCFKHTNNAVSLNIMSRIFQYSEY